MEIGGLSRGAAAEYSSAIRELFPDNLVTAAGCCHDISSYQPAKWHIETGEGFIRFSGMAGPGFLPGIFSTGLSAGLNKTSGNSAL